MKKIIFITIILAVVSILAFVGWLLLFSTDNVKPVPQSYPDDSPKTPIVPLQL